MGLIDQFPLSTLHYQFVIRDASSSDMELPDYDDEPFQRTPNAIRVLTEADLNHHWVQVWSADAPPAPCDDRFVRAPLEIPSGRLLVHSVIDDPGTERAIRIPRGQYTAFICGANLGVDERFLGEDAVELEHLASRTDLERYRIVLVPGHHGEPAALREPDRYAVRAALGVYEDVCARAGVAAEVDGETAWAMRRPDIEAAREAVAAHGAYGERAIAFLLTADTEWAQLAAAIHTRTIVPARSRAALERLAACRDKPLLARLAANALAGPS